ncbi:MAG TPA: hypothetical protein VD948_03030 [Rhodothermales bacterium]|nr:hypothetical protein [Rhodothermales bacterium]
MSAAKHAFDQAPPPAHREYQREDDRLSLEECRICLGPVHPATEYIEVRAGLVHYDCWTEAQEWESP